MIATATPATYRSALSTLLEDDGVSSAIAIFVPPLGVKQEDVAEAVVQAAATCKEKPVLAVLMGRRGLPQGRAELSPAKIPAFIFPESAARALSTLIRYREWIERAQETPPRLKVDTARATAILKHASDDGRDRLNELEALDLLDAYGIPAARGELVHSADEAAAAVGKLGSRAVLKIVSRDVIHKTDVGGVETGVVTAEEGAAAFERIVSRVKSAVAAARVDGVLVQPHVPSGRELILGLARDPQFGALLMFGLGGVYVEALRDVVFRIAPITRADASEMTHGIRGVSILAGVRGQPSLNFTMLEDVLLRLSQLAMDFAEIAELDVNPLVAYPDAVTAVDCRVKFRGEGVNGVKLGMA
jgi:acetyltransferase